MISKITDRLMLAVTLAVVGTLAPAVLASDGPSDALHTAQTVVWTVVTGLLPL